MLKKLICLFFILPGLVLAANFKEGVDYLVVSNPQAKEIPNKKTLVTEFFSYGCPWCYKIDAPLNQWALNMKSGIELERVPVVFKPEWNIYAKAYYTAKTLALSDKLNPKLFKAIQDDKNPLSSNQSMTDFFVVNDVDKEIAKSAFENSPTIDMKVQNGMTLLANYQIKGVPAFVVNNKYQTDLQMAGNQERLFQILDYLVKKG